MDKRTPTAGKSDTMVITNLPERISEKKHFLIEKGETPFTGDETLRYFYFILSGKIKISQIHPLSSKEQTTHLLSRGDMFDVVTLLDSDRHDYIATALERSEIVQVPIGHIREKIDTDPAFKRFFFPYLARQMRQMGDLAVDLSLYDVYHRLLRLIERNMEVTEDKSELHLINDLSHEELAALVGTVRKVLNRNLQKLKQDGIIDISRKQISLRDIKKLLDFLE